MKSMRWFTKQSLPAERPTTSRKITVLCMATDFRIWMAASRELAYMDSSAIEQS
jgi:hypothetical protein